ncbi:MAG TPA: hypothetical protein VNO14_13355 [Blastocatellia bacterium]|nr:hypothetical protein [Blastocatellia bacterium]
MMISLREFAASLVSPVEQRLFAEYGAIFLTRATPPPAVMFRDQDEVERFQASLDTARALLGEHEIELQAAAMQALLDAASAIAEEGRTLTARAADAGRRSYEDTVRLWTRNVTRGLEHWQQQLRLSADRAREIERLSPTEQVAVILEMEEAEQIYFGTYFDKSILYSVAAPGASQHLSLLAFDVAEFEEEAAERVLGEFGWFRTVVNDFPHFTYLGREPGELEGLGLKQVLRPYKNRDYRFWIPNL